MSSGIKNDTPMCHYNISMGPVSIGCDAEYKEEVKRLDALIACLGRPNIGRWTMRKAVVEEIVHLRVVAVRLWTFVTTGTWMNEALARKLVKQYAKSANGEKSDEQTEKMKLIYDRLAQIKRKEGTYADGIDRESIGKREEPKKVVPLSPQESFYQIVTDPRLQKTAQVIGNLAMEAFLFVVASYALAGIDKTKKAALGPLLMPASRVVTV